MRINKIVTTVIFSICLGMPLMAGSATSEHMIADAKKVTKSISSKELQKKIANEDDLWMLDVREPYMRGEGSIEGMDNEAVSLGVLMFDIESKIEDKNALVVVYCRQGKSAVLAAKMLTEDLHYKNVVYLDGGLESWLNGGNSIFNDLGELRLVTE